MMSSSLFYCDVRLMLLTLHLLNYLYIQITNINQVLVIYLFIISSLLFLYIYSTYLWCFTQHIISDTHFLSYVQLFSSHYNSFRTYISRAFRQRTFTEVGRTRKLVILSCVQLQVLGYIHYYLMSVFTCASSTGLSSCHCKALSVCIVKCCHCGISEVRLWVLWNVLRMKTWRDKHSHFLLWL